MDDREEGTRGNGAARDDGARWIVGVDGSECSRHAALWAVAHARGRASELQLATAWSVPAAAMTSPMTMSTTGVLYESCEATAHDVVDALARSLAPSLDIPVTSSVGQGGASSLLLEAARHGELLVVGSRGHGGFARLLLGSTSAQCATHSAVPVAVIPSTAPLDSATTIVVAVDGSTNSLAALAWAHDFAAPGSVVESVSVWDTSPIAVGSDRFFFPDASELAKDRAEDLVMRTIAPIARDDVEVRHSFVLGHPRQILQARAAAADLLVMGARGHGAIGAALLGSVSTWLLHHGRRPMIVVPTEVDRATGLDNGVVDE